MAGRPALAADSAASAAAKRPPPPPPLAVHVKGNRLIDQHGRTIRLLGVDRAGSEYACVFDFGFFDGPADAKSIAAIKAWHANAVRIPLNEDCWLGINLASDNPYQGAAYRNAIAAFVARLNRAGLYAILDLHWVAPGSFTANSTNLQPMADSSHGPAFWASVAKTFAAAPAVIFDLYNEPNGISWNCWLNGCEVTRTDFGSWRTAGMRSLVAAVRNAGATQPLVLSGLGYASDLSQWRAYLPGDPLARSRRDPVPGQAQLIAGYHSYCGPPGTGTAAACRGYIGQIEAGEWPAVAGVSRQAPVITGELGEYDCGTTYVTPFMRFADAHGLSYLGWAWDPYPCGVFPALIKNYGGTPTAFGAGLKSHFARINP